MSDTQAQAVVDEHAVVDFLNHHPEFFSRHPELLLKLKIPHVQAGASSLLERQIKLARDKHRDLQGQMIELLQTAAGNELLFSQCRDLVLTVLDALPVSDARLAPLLTALERELMRGFQLDAALILPDSRHAGRFGERRCASQDERRAGLGPELLRGPWCGTPSASERRFLFGDVGEALQSAASLPLGAHGEAGLLALGSRDPERFRAGMGTLFLDFVGALLTRLLHHGAT